MSERIKILLFQSSFLLIALFIIEFYLRFAGYQPGDLTPNWLNFQPVDSLYTISNFTTNTEGILVADRSLNQPNIYINSDGFRNKEFSKIDSSKKKLLFIGDSFTWGLSAKPLDSCFTDIIRNETNYEIVNLGIPVADPPQYYELAKKYIPLLNPDFVFIQFFMDNDLMRYDRKVTPNEPIYFLTNAGAILADIDGKHFSSAQAAYNYCVNEKYFLNKPENAVEWVISKSSLLSRLYSFRYRLNEKLLYEKTVRDAVISKKYLNGITAIAKQNHVPIKFMLIPARNEADMDLQKYKKRYSSLLTDSALHEKWLTFQNSSSNFTDYPDAHLNNKGHRAYADSLKLFLSNYFHSQ